MKLEEAKEKMFNLYPDLKEYREERPWGAFTKFVNNEQCTIKIIEVNKRLSLQYHEKRSEIWFILEGKVKIQLDDDFHELESGQMCYLPVGVKHRAENLSDKTSKLLEISLGEFDENDIIRLEDDFGRV